MFDITDFDAAVDRAWVTFQHKLADHLSAMRTDDILILDWIEETTVDGFTPWLQFLAWDDAYLRAEVSSNAYLAPRYALTPQSEERLCDLGWTRPTRLPDEDPDDGSPAFFVDREQRWADQLAAMTVTTLREIWNVPHPSFLIAEHVGTLEGATVLDSPGPEPEHPPLDESAAFEARDRHELRNLVARAVEQTLGFVPEVDADGDIVLRLDDRPVFVITHPEQPLVRVWVPLLRGIVGRTRAAENIADLTKRWPGIRFILDEDRLDASIDVSGNPFVPRHLADALEQFSRFAPNVDDRFAQRFGATRVADESPDHDDSEAASLPPDPDADADADADGMDESDLPPALLTLLHLDPHGSGMSPQDVAAVCGHDRDAVLDYLRITKEQELSWDESADTARALGDSDEADACAHEARAWARTHESLLAALRLIALPDPPRPAPTTGKPVQMDLFGEAPHRALFEPSIVEPPDHTTTGGG